MSREIIECRICGADSSTMYVNPRTKLCKVCSSDFTCNEYGCSIRHNER